MKGSFVVRGAKLRTQSHFRFQLVAIRTSGEARIFGRTDKLASARERIAKARAYDPTRTVVILDSATGEEVV